MKTLVAMIMLVGLVAIVACEDDDPVKARNSPAEYENLSLKEHVLNNIELAYSRRNIARYTELLDDNFTFYLATGDVGGGIPTQWDRAVEVRANISLFGARDIDMDIRWEDGVTWVQVPAFGGETWYTATVFYNFQVDAPPSYAWINPPGAKAQFTVRNVGEESPRWQLVEMRDLGGPGLVTEISRRTESVTWGRLKAMYAVAIPSSLFD